MNGPCSRRCTTNDTLATALQESEHRFRAIVETSLQGKLAHRRFEPLFLNPAFRDMFGLDPATQPTSADIIGLMNLEPPHTPESMWGHILASGSVRLRRTLRRANGALFRADIFARIVQWDEEPAVVMAIMDLTEEERTQRRLREAQRLTEAAARAKRRFLASAGHALRTPLHAAIGRLDLLLRERLAPQSRSTAKAAMTACHRLWRSLDDLMDVAALESGELSLLNQAFDLRPCMEEALAAVKEQADAQHVSLALVERDSDTRRVIGDENRVRRLTAGLLEEGLRRNPDAVTSLIFDVSETGVVITVEAPGAIATPVLGQLDEAALSGIAMARALSQAMGGMLFERITSCGSWQATARLPLELCEAAPATDHGGQRHILVVEDNPGNRVLIKLLLENLGHRVDLAEDGAAGVAAAAEHAYDLVLMDLSMPGIDGLEATRRIRALDRPWANLPIAALTASSAPGVHEAVAEAGMDAFLVKPIQIDRLAEAIHHLTAQSDGSVEPFELNEIEQHDHNDETDNRQKRSHG